MTKHLEAAGITRVQTDLDYSEEGFSKVKVDFVFTADDLDEGQRELVKIVEKAITANVFKKGDEKG